MDRLIVHYVDGTEQIFFDDKYEWTELDSSIEISTKEYDNGSRVYVNLDNVVWYRIDRDVNKE